MILYEYPFNERVRTYLRLEHLLQRLGALLPRESALDHHFALTTLFEVLDVAARADLKSEVLKELERHKSQINGYRGNPAISEAALDQVVGQIEAAFAQLAEQQGKPGHALADNEWLMGLRSRMAIPGATCSFDVPAYHAWQHRAAAQRREDLGHWVSSFAPLGQAVHLLLHLLRDSGAPQMVMAGNGQFQQTLPSGRTFQLLRLRVDPSWNVVPEISGNRLMVSVRLMRQDAAGRLQSTREDAPLELTLCTGAGNV